MNSSLLEKRIKLLENKLNIKNEEAGDPAQEAVFAAANQVDKIVNDLCVTLRDSDISEETCYDIKDSLFYLDNTFSKKALDRLKAILKIKLGR